LASRIDHTLLRPDATLEQILAVCDEARAHGFASVCVHSHWLPEVVRALRGSGTLPIAVVGFPHGSMLPQAKAAETRLAVKAGAKEIDMVINLGRLKSRDWKSVFEDIRGVVQAAGKSPVKVILETCLLTDEEKVAAAALSELAGAAFVKTSTGYSSGGATIEDVSLLRKAVSPKVKIKASGGVRSREIAEALLAAGADRLGASSSVSLISATAPNPSTGSY
ncbi:deoxyribose-phosphate aldolase, partial [bacterium]|nr:deoxyribose-phosphate aldolase [bacterium]